MSNQVRYVLKNGNQMVEGRVTNSDKQIVILNTFFLINERNIRKGLKKIFSRNLFKKLFKLSTRYLRAASIPFLTIQHGWRADNSAWKDKILFNTKVGFLFHF